ncbi:MAG: response regulator [Chloroflexota bacterium]
MQNVVKTFLVIDDEPAIRQLLVEILKWHCPQAVCYEAEDGLEGLEKACQLCPDFIFVDGLLPQMEGPDLAALLRHKPQTQHSVLIGITGQNRQSYLYTGLDKYCDRVLIKPFNVDDIRAVLDQLMISTPQVVSH